MMINNVDGVGVSIGRLADYSRQRPVLMGLLQRAVAVYVSATVRVAKMRLGVKGTMRRSQRVSP